MSTPRSETLVRLHEVMASGRAFASAHGAFGVRFVRAEPGVSVARMPLEAALETDDRMLAAGGLLVLFDAVLGSCVASALPPGSAMTTLTMHMQFVDLAPGPGGWIHGTGRRVAADSGSALSSAELVDDAGRLLAVGTSRCVVLPEAAATPLEEPGPLRDDDPGAWRQAVTVGTTGDTAVGRTDAAAEWANPRGRMQGGAVAMVAERTLQPLWGDDGLASAACLDLDVTYLRGVPTDGRPLECRAALGHRGRSLGVAHADVLDGEHVVARLTATRYHRRR